MCIKLLKQQYNIVYFRVLGIAYFAKLEATELQKTICTKHVIW